MKRFGVISPDPGRGDNAVSGSGFDRPPLTRFGERGILERERLDGSIPPFKGAKTIVISFKDFLQQKAGETGWKERAERRVKWLEAVERLFARVQDLLNEADPDGLLEIVRYKVERVEERLGVYDAPALKIRLATQSVDVVPVGLNVPKPLRLMNLLAVQGNQSRWGDLAAGRVDVTDGERRHMLFRSVDTGRDCWYVMINQASGIKELDRQSLEEILQDLLS